MNERTMVIPQLAGLSVRLKDGTVVKFIDGEDGNAGGVREPRKPNPKTPAPAVAKIKEDTCEHV